VNSGFLTISLSASPSLFTTAFGVPAGTKAPYQGRSQLKPFGPAFTERRNIEYELGAVGTGNSEMLDFARPLQFAHGGNSVDADWEHATDFIRQHAGGSLVGNRYQAEIVMLIEAQQAKMYGATQ